MLRSTPTHPEPASPGPRPPAQPAGSPRAAAPDEFLRLCIARYDGLLDALHALKAGSRPSVVAKLVKLVAVFATNHHPGRFADGALDNPLLELGAQLPRTRLALPGASRAAPGRRGPRVVHVASRVFDIGGHTRMIANWAASDPTSTNSLLLVSQQDTPVPARLRREIEATGGTVCQLPPACSFLDKAAWARQFIREAADLAILHIGQDDVATILALAEPGGPPVALVNQAAHVFWLGSGVADGIINLREPDSPISRERRFMRHDFQLPIPLDGASTRPSRTQARQRLGIPQDQLVLLSVGRGVKYLSSDALDFFRAANRILQRNPQAHLYLVGVEAKDHAAATGRGSHERLHCMGALPDPSWFQAAADLYLEGFPFGSQTAFLEAALAGLPAVAAPTTRCRLLVTDDPALTGLIVPPETEAQFVEQATELVERGPERLELGRRLSERVRAMHTGEGWRARLDGLYGELAGLSHLPVPVPLSPASLADADQEVSGLHRVRFQGRDAAGGLDAWIRDSLDYWARDLWEEGELRGALSFLRMARSHGGRTPRAVVSAALGTGRWLQRTLARPL